MNFLLDGYNLLHALGFATRNMAGKGLERARLKMLDWLGERHGESASSVRVVFDALHATRGDQTRQTYRGIKVEFAFKELADDRIEELILAERRPRSLHVVSNDTRIRDFSRRRGCVAWSSDEYVDWLIRGQRAAASSAPPPEKSEEASDEEMAAWLAAFEKRP